MLFYYPAAGVCWLAAAVIAIIFMTDKIKLLALQVVVSSNFM